MAKRLIATVALWVESFADGRPTVYPAEARCLECWKKGEGIYYSNVSEEQVAALTEEEAARLTCALCGKSILVEVDEHP